MPKKDKKKNVAVVGRALMKSRFASGSALNPDGSIRHTTELLDGAAAAWQTNYSSITQESDLDAFLSTAQLAGTEFTAERLNVQVIEEVPHDLSNMFLLTPEAEAELQETHASHRDKLSVPRRPDWTTQTTKSELDMLERHSFLEWRRGLVILEETLELLMTPYERNLQVWRQLWRVVERSDMVVQIVDARNPLLFMSGDVTRYVTEVDPRKKNLVLINKADMLGFKQRLAWANYFEANGIEYRFFSAALARKIQDDIKAEADELAREVDQREKSVADALRGEDGESVLDRDDSWEKISADIEDIETALDSDVSDAGSDSDQEDENEELKKADEADRQKVKMLNVEELLDLFMAECPKPLREKDVKSTIGFVGYPNVGKSSTLNALAGAKCVAVASTPGKTKHFQTIHLNPLPLVICDCPGLVFPSFATTKADMVTNGILPIDQLRECTGPCALISQRMPQPVLEKIYGIRMRTLDPEGCHETRTPTAPEFLQAYARSRGYTKSGQGNPDESRAARYILKDYVAGKLVFAVPPPGISADEFNKGTYTRFLAGHSRVSMVNSKILNADVLSGEKELAARGIVEDDVEAEEKKKEEEAEVKDRSALLDDFINDTDSYVRVAADGKDGYSRTKMFPHQNERDASGYVKVDRSAEAAAVGNGKKSHHKGKKNEKKRTKWTMMNDL